MSQFVTNLRLFTNRKLQMQVRVLEDHCQKEHIDDGMRVAHNKVCNRCGFQYIDHPLDGPWSYEGQRFLNRLCDGRLVKL